MDRIYPQIWMSLDKDVQDVLKKEFDIKQGGVKDVIISTGQVLSDGYRTEDLSVLNVENMMKFVVQDTPLPFMRMWELTLAKVKFILNPPVMDMNTQELSPKPLRKALWCYYCESKGFAHRPECTRPIKIVEEEKTVEVPVEEIINIIAPKEDDNTKKNTKNKGSN